jgi:Kef-type K+ transport system membrane component KefB
LIIEGVFRNEFGSSGLPYRIPAELQGAWDLGFMFMPIYRGWVVLVAFFACLATWLVIEKTKIGSYLRAATENPALVQAFGINVPRMMTLTYGAGVALAAFAGVLAAPIYSVNPQMGSNLIIIVFAVVVIGGMGSILGSIITGFGLNTPLYGGGFGAGILLSEYMWFSTVCMVIFLPLYFISVGMRLPVASLLEIRAWSLATFLVVVALLSKLACGLGVSAADRRAGVDPWVVAYGLIPRGLPGLVFATTALARGLIDSLQFAALLIMVTVTTVLGLLLLERRLARLSANSGLRS